MSKVPMHGIRCSRLDPQLPVAFNLLPETYFSVFVIDQPRVLHVNPEMSLINLSWSAPCHGCDEITSVRHECFPTGGGVEYTRKSLHVNFLGKS